MIIYQANEYLRRVDNHSRLHSTLPPCHSFNRQQDRPASIPNLIIQGGNGGSTGNVTNGNIVFGDVVNTTTITVNNNVTSGGNAGNGRAATANGVGGMAGGTSGVQSNVAGSYASNTEGGRDYEIQLTLPNQEYQSHHDDVDCIFHTKFQKSYNNYPIRHMFLNLHKEDNEEYLDDLYMHFQNYNLTRKQAGKTMENYIKGFESRDVVHW